MRELYPTIWFDQGINLLLGFYVYRYVQEGKLRKCFKLLVEIFKLSVDIFQKAGLVSEPLKVGFGLWSQCVTGASVFQGVGVELQVGLHHCVLGIEQQVCLGTLARVDHVAGLEVRQLQVLVVREEDVVVPFTSDEIHGPSAVLLAPQAESKMI